MVKRSIPQLFDLAGRRALVTGSVRGLGLEITRGLAEAGASVLINGRVADTVEKAVAELAAEGRQASALVLDIDDEGAVADWFAADGKLDILVNNVGMRDRRGSADLPTADFSRLLQLGITTAYRMTRLAHPGMAARGGGAVINVVSVAGPLARPGDPGYTAAKGGLDALTRSHAVEFAPDNVRVNAIAPGFFATEANAAWLDDPAVNDYVARRIPMQRWGQPQEIAGAAVYLASDAASYVTGHTLTVDAGLSIRM